MGNVGTRGPDAARSRRRAALGTALLLGGIPLLGATAPGCGTNGSSSPRGDGAAQGQDGGTGEDAGAPFADGGDATVTTTFSLAHLAVPATVF